MNRRLAESYEEFPRIEDDFRAALDESLVPRSPELLYELVERLGLPEGSLVVDVGCGDGTHSYRLAERFGFSVVGVDKPRSRQRACGSRSASTSAASGPSGRRSSRVPSGGSCSGPLACCAPPDRYRAHFGQAAYEIMLGDCLWQVYAMLGKLEGRVYVLLR